MREAFARACQAGAEARMPDRSLSKLCSLVEYPKLCGGAVLFVTQTKTIVLTTPSKLKKNERNALFSAQAEQRARHRT